MYKGEVCRGGCGSRTCRSPIHFNTRHLFRIKHRLLIPDQRSLPREQPTFYPAYLHSILKLTSRESREPVECQHVGINPDRSEERPSESDLEDSLPRARSRLVARETRRLSGGVFAGADHAPRCSSLGRETTARSEIISPCTMTAFMHSMRNSLEPL